MSADFDIDDLDKEHPEYEHQLALLETGQWGRSGAGCIVFSRNTNKFLIGFRSDEVVDPLTWGTWGGAISNGMTPEATVIEELNEETEYNGELELIKVYSFQAPNSAFVYHNYIAVVDDEFIPELNWENSNYGWYEQGAFPEPMHPGFKEMVTNVPDLLAIINENISSKNNISL